MFIDSKIAKMLHDTLLILSNALHVSNISPMFIVKMQFLHYNAISVSADFTVDNIFMNDVFLKVIYDVSNPLCKFFKGIV